MHIVCTYNTYSVVHVALTIHIAHEECIGIFQCAPDACNTRFQFFVLHLTLWWYCGIAVLCEKWANESFFHKMVDH